MCGRFVQLLPAEAIRALFGTEGPPPNVAASWNVAPSQPAAVVRRHPESGARHASLLTWGLVPHFNRDPKGGRKPINARGETVAENGLFRSAFAARRCLVPIAAFYEWHVDGATKTPHAIAATDGATLALGGIWEGWRGEDGTVVRSFAVVTTTASPDIAALHERMPVIVAQADWPLWLGEAPGDPRALIRPAPTGTLKHWIVSRRVNAPANNDAALLEPA